MLLLRLLLLLLLLLKEVPWGRNIQPSQSSSSLPPPLVVLLSSGLSSASGSLGDPTSLISVSNRLIGNLNVMTIVSLVFAG
jgi:hypothetical protein